MNYSRCPKCGAPESDFINTTFEQSEKCKENAKNSIINNINKKEDLYTKLSLYSGADEHGKYWVITGRKSLRENDLVELADWIARELKWIPRQKG